jgi:ABC-2 type transport system ATP-binding protein
VAEAVRLFCDLYGRRRDASELIGLVGLTSRARSTWRQLSGGERQRLALALALAGEPQVAFLDEPTASVDVAGRQQLRAVIRSLADAGCCVLLTTHELGEADRLADRIVIVDHGRCVAEGSPAELRALASTPEIRFGTAAALDIGSLGTALGGTVVEESPGEYVARVAPSPAAVATVTAWLAERDLPLADLRAGRQSLEDVFLRLTSPTETAP